MDQIIYGCQIYINTEQVHENKTITELFIAADVTEKLWFVNLGLGTLYAPKIQS